jgi:hypothetical protein
MSMPREVDKSVEEDVEFQSVSRASVALEDIVNEA